MTEDQLTVLIRKYLSGEASENEKKQVEQWYENFDASPLEFMEGDAHKIRGSAFRSLKAVRRKIRRLQTVERQQGVQVVVGRRQIHLRRLAAVAAVLLLVSGMLYFWVHPVHKQPSGIADEHLKNDLPPGGNKAILTLANGQSIVLDSSNNGVLCMQGNAKIIKMDSGQLSYNASAHHAGQVLFNTIATPRGGQYQVQLSDGSRVWLNAASSIRFPTVFTGKVREVQVKGEAYFEIAKDKDRPFKIAIITHAGMEGEVEVLGTHFNIMAYDDEPLIKTTLLEGSVKVIKGNHSRVLAPGEQAQLNNQSPDDEDIRWVKGINVNEVMAWKDNIFWFDGADIETVMRQLSLWYDVDVAIEGNISQHFTGFIPRDVSVSKVFEVLQKAGGIHYRIEEGKIIVSP